MNLVQRGILTCVLLMLAAGASAQERYVEGVHYRRLEDPSAAGALGVVDGKASVLEVFWYGCAHCYAFDPLLNDWVADKGDSVAFTRSPMVWDANTRQHARLFHAAQALGLHARMHTRIFDEIHRERNYLLDEASMEALFAEFGVDKSGFAKTFKSFAVDADVRKTESAQRGMAIPSVPALIVNGTWLINTTNAVPSHQAMLDVADFLLGKSP